jgi:hypothetical protein
MHFFHSLLFHVLSHFRKHSEAMGPMTLAIRRVSSFFSSPPSLSIFLFFPVLLLHIIVFSESFSGVWVHHGAGVPFTPTMNSFIVWTKGPSTSISWWNYFYYENLLPGCQNAKRSSVPPRTYRQWYCTVRTVKQIASSNQSEQTIFLLCSSTTIHAQSQLPRNYGMAGHPKGSETSDIRNRCRWIQGLCATGRKDQLRTLPMKGSSYKYHNYMRFSIQTHLFAVYSASVASINRQSEEAIAVTVDREAAANVQIGICSSTYR